MWKYVNHSLKVISNLLRIFILFCRFIDIKMHCSLCGITPKMSVIYPITNNHMDKIVSSSNTTVDYFESP